MILPEHIREVLAKATCIYSRTEVELAFDRIAEQINACISDKNPMFLCVVVGGIIPMGNLLTRLDFPLELDYIHVTRYQGGLKGGSIEWKVTPNCNLKDRTVVVVDDILDGGLTLGSVVEYCKSQGAKKIYSVVLVDKEGARVEGGLQQPDFYGLKVNNHYVFGYGMDYKGYLRNAPGIYMVAQEHE